MLTQTVITAGIEFDADNNPLSEDKQAMALAIARAMLAKEYGGYTETRTMGGWVNGDGVLVTEAGRQWTMLSYFDTLPEAYHKVERIAEKVREAFEQAAVVSAVQELHYAFVSKPETVEG